MFEWFRHISKQLHHIHEMLHILLERSAPGDANLDGIKAQTAALKTSGDALSAATESASQPATPT